MALNQSINLIPIWLKYLSQIQQPTQQSWTSKLKLNRTEWRMKFGLIAAIKPRKIAVEFPFSKSEIGIDGWMNDREWNENWMSEWLAWLINNNKINEWNSTIRLKSTINQLNSFNQFIQSKLKTFSLIDEFRLIEWLNWLSWLAGLIECNEWNIITVICEWNEQINKWM